MWKSYLPFKNPFNLPILDSKLGNKIIGEVIVAWKSKSKPISFKRKEKEREERKGISSWSPSIVNTSTYIEIQSRVSTQTLVLLTKIRDVDSMSLLIRSFLDVLYGFLGSYDD